MSGVLYLAWRHILWHRWKSITLIAAITMVMYLPVGLQLVIQKTAQEMTSRADSTPLLLGRRGSPLELVLNSLYFSLDHPAALKYAEMETLTDSELATPVPLYVRFHSQQVPIVGTSLDYFDFRNLKVAHGRAFATLGEAVLGAEAAQQLEVGVGDKILSSPESVFDIAGVYPLNMPVVGILERQYNQDDSAIFVDVKTAWIIKGLGHGHQDLQSKSAAGAILKTEEQRIVANASLVQYNEITADNIDSFHFHGNDADLPLTAIIPVPSTDKDGVLLQGRYQSNQSLQILSPRAVTDELLDTAFSVQRYIMLAMMLVAVATSAVVLLVLLLSWRSRYNEQRTLIRLGGSPLAVNSLMLAEAVIVMLSSSLLTTALTLLTMHFGDNLIRMVVL